MCGSKRSKKVCEIKTKKIRALMHLTFFLFLVCHNQFKTHDEAGESPFWFGCKKTEVTGWSHGQYRVTIVFEAVLQRTSSKDK